MIKNTFLGLGPMSVEVINSLNYFSKKYKKKIMLICSRNQIETESLGGGYVNNFNTENFSKFIKSKNNKYLIMARDHCGPFKRDGDKQKFKIADEVSNCKKSLYDDIVNDFQLLHIDTSECKSLKYEIADELLNYCNLVAKKNKKKIFFEFGCEDHGVMTDFKKFSNDAKFFSKYNNRQFIVCQTGSLVKSVFQVGQFDIDSIKIMKKIASENGILLKEHNCDYLSRYQINLRKQFGINAVNIAPELGVMQTTLVYYLSKKIGINKEIDDFKKIFLQNKKWQKWNYNNENNLIKFFSAGHYHFNCKEYKKVFNKINRKINIQKKLNNIIEAKLKNFFN